MQGCHLSEEISKKKRELEYLVAQKRNIQDEEIYQKSLELDDLVVKVMRNNAAEIKRENATRG